VTLTARQPSNASTPLSDFSEDCLTLNILRPAGITKEKKLPVLVWVFGGGFYEGASSLYPANGIVARSVNRSTPVIYVSLNYRLGPLGVCNSPFRHGT
jgi:acetylcholinesterase